MNDDFYSEEEPLEGYKNFRIVLRLPVVAILDIHATSKSDIKDNISQSRLSSFIDEHGGYDTENVEMEIYDERDIPNYRPMTVKEFNESWDNLW
tara:strand:+ start:1253 stop:1534 length:282 start_codon:yes stop_codon:yes gene_type:complete